MTTVPVQKSVDYKEGRIYDLLRSARSFYERREGLLYTQSAVILCFHAFVIGAFLFQRAAPAGGHEPVAPNPFRGFALYADDWFWMLVHSVILTLAVVGIVARRTGMIATAFTISFLLWLIWGFMLFAWSLQLPRASVVAAGAILIVTVPIAAANAWVWTEREAQEL